MTNQLIRDIKVAVVPALVTTGSILVFTITLTLHLAEDKAAKIIRMQLPAIFFTALVAGTLGVRAKGDGATYPGREEPAIAYTPASYPPLPAGLGQSQRVDVSQLIDQATQPQAQSLYGLREIDLDSLIGQRPIGGED